MIAFELASSSGIVVHIHPMYEQIKMILMFGNLVNVMNRCRLFELLYNFGNNRPKIRIRMIIKSSIIRF